MGHRSPAVRCSRMGAEPRLFREYGEAAIGGLCCCAPRVRTAGFTLIEMMVTVAIIGILAAIAYPSYVQYVVRSNRAAAESFLMEVASLQERYLVDRRAYATTLTALGYASLPGTISANYTVTVATVSSPPGYVLTATPQGGQASRDTACGTLTLSQAGQKTATGSATNCWK